MDVKEQEIRVREELKRAGGGIIGAAHARCIECSYDPLAEGSMVEQIDACAMSDCQLFPHRKRTANSANILEAKLPEEHKPAKEGWKRKDNLLLSLQSKKTLRAAINAFCVDCIFDPNANKPDPSGSWRQQVKACKNRKCPLWTERATTINPIIEEFTVNISKNTKCQTCKYAMPDGDDYNPEEFSCECPIPVWIHPSETMDIIDAQTKHEAEYPPITFCRAHEEA